MLALKGAAGAIQLFVQSINGLQPYLLLLLAHTRGVEALAEPGAAQMGADVEYFVNVVAALSLEPPPQLVAYAACCAAPRDSYAIIAKDEGVDQDVARAVARMRNIRIE